VLARAQGSEAKRFRYLAEEADGYYVSDSRSSVVLSIGYVRDGALAIASPQVSLKELGNVNYMASWITATAKACV